MQNKNIERYLVLLLPSAISTVFCTFAAGLVVVLNQFSFIQGYLQLPSDVNLGRLPLNWLDHTVTGLIGRSATQVLVVGLFWALVGLVVYMCLWGFMRFVSDLSEDLSTRRYIWPGAAGRSRAIHGAIMRALFRVFALALLITLLLVLLPGELKRPGSTLGLLGYGLWFLGLWLTLHGVVVLLRLITLKSRLFG